MPVLARIEVTDSARHTVGERYPGDDKDRNDGDRTDYHPANVEPLSWKPTRTPEYARATIDSQLFLAPRGVKRIMVDLSFYRMLFA
jgi:hypothetical protein